MGSRGGILGSFLTGTASGFAGGAGDVVAAHWQAKKKAKKEGVRKAERQEILDIQQRVRESAAESQKMSHLLQSTPAEYRAGVLSKGVDWASSPEGQATIKGQWGKQKQEALDLMKTKHRQARELALIAARSRGGASSLSQRGPYAALQNALREGIANTKTNAQAVKDAREVVAKAYPGPEQIAAQKILDGAINQWRQSDRVSKLLSRINVNLTSHKIPPTYAQAEAAAEAYVASMGLPATKENVDRALLTLDLDRFTPQQTQWQGAFGQSGIPYREPR